MSIQRTIADRFGLGEYDSAGVSVSIDLSGVWPSLRDAAIEALTDELSMAEERARRLCPVGEVAREGEGFASRTPGTLRDSILSRVVTVDDGYTVLGYLKAGAEGSQGKAFYAHMVENGTKKMPARPFLRPAAEGIDIGRIAAALEGLDV